MGRSTFTFQWRHNGCDGVWNHQPHDCLLNCLFSRRSKKTSKLRATGLCAGNSPVTGEFPAQMIRNADNVSIWWRHHVTMLKRHAIHIDQKIPLTMGQYCGKRLFPAFPCYDDKIPFPIKTTNNESLFSQTFIGNRNEVSYDVWKEIMLDYSVFTYVSWLCYLIMILTLLIMLPLYLLMIWKSHVWGSLSIINGNDVDNFEWNWWWFP